VEESSVLQGCLGGCALAHQQLEGLVAAWLLTTVGLGTKTKLFPVKNKAKQAPSPFNLGLFC